MANTSGVHTMPDSPALGGTAEGAATSVPTRTLLDLFEQFAALECECVVYDDGYRSWSYQYREIANAARAFADRLRHESIGSGDKVLIWSENRPEWIAAFWGCVLNGTTVVPVDYRASGEVLRNTNRAVGARVVLAGDDVRGARARGVNGAVARVIGGVGIGPGRRRRAGRSPLGPGPRPSSLDAASRCDGHRLVRVDG